jgi:hypothetical protein
LDYPANLEALDKRGLDIKRHLGFEAFETGNPSSLAKVPKFRYEEQWNAKWVKYVTSSHKNHDILSNVHRSEWKTWIENNQKIALAFVSELKVEGLVLDFSTESLHKLDNYIEGSNLAKAKPSVDFVKRLGAYVSQVIIRQNGARWSFDDSDEIPSLRIGEGIQMTPLVRVLKVLERGEKFAHWYGLIDKISDK